MLYQVSILKAELHKDSTDGGFFGFDKQPDAYVKTTVEGGTSTYKTNVCSNTHQPVFDQRKSRFNVEMPHATGTTFNFHCNLMDENFLKDQEIATCKGQLDPLDWLIPHPRDPSASAIVIPAKGTLTLPLLRENKNEEVVIGKLYVEIVVTPLQAGAKFLHDDKAGRVTDLLLTEYREGLHRLQGQSRGILKIQAACRQQLSANHFQEKSNRRNKKQRNGDGQLVRVGETEDEGEHQNTQQGRCQMSNVPFAEFCKTVPTEETVFYTSSNTKAPAARQQPGSSSRRPSPRNDRSNAQQRPATSSTTSAKAKSALVVLQKEESDWRTNCLLRFSAHHSAWVPSVEAVEQMRRNDTTRNAPHRFPVRFQGGPRQPPTPSYNNGAGGGGGGGSANTSSSRGRLRRPEPQSELPRVKETDSDYEEEEGNFAKERDPSVERGEEGDDRAAHHAATYNVSADESKEQRQKTAALGPFSVSPRRQHQRTTPYHLSQPRQHRYKLESVEASNSGRHHGGGGGRPALYEPRHRREKYTGSDGGGGAANKQAPLPQHSKEEEVGWESEARKERRGSADEQADHDTSPQRKVPKPPSSRLLGTPRSENPSAEATKWRQRLEELRRGGSESERNKKNRNHETSLSKDFETVGPVA